MKIQRVRKNGTSMCITIPPSSGLTLKDCVTVTLTGKGGMLIVRKYRGKVKVRGRQVSAR